ncbi:diacylglycerol kinase [Aequorivita lipolytica]|uniref:Diacylglycerol kinase family protein n=1 Tax=Aequorivita lipolytica TaxID=153267 RepID=A0A5C6YMR3_9FLAO|nr:diacylglycerol kinase family protein [Aequorivita lipolytica]TXD68573.1 diacylglycerol kinase family protein [Aequorivita lipolytica]SRX53277.1 Undecaprenol kinase [Aequorivita lipolytica]
MWDSFLGKRLKGCGYALKGALLLLRNEASIQVQAAIAVIMTFAGFYFEISTTEWMFQIFAIGLVLSIEGLNTAAEEIADFVHPDFHNKIGFIKDIAAGAVFFAAITAVIIGCIIYIPKL